MTPLYVGQFSRRLDTRRQLRLPILWRFGQTQSWLIYPPELFGEGRANFRDLRLEPVQGHTAARILDTLKVPTKRRPTLETAIEALRAIARVRGIDPLVVSPHRTDARSVHIKLSEAQLAWLGARSRSLTLTGVMTAIQIWTAEEFARWERYTSSPAFAKSVRRALRDS
jgi:hypothetical protein